MWFVYALYNAKNDKTYIGVSQNAERRLVEHNKKRGNHFTAKITGEWILIYKENIENKSKALKREKQLKSYRGRVFIKQFITK